MEREEQMETINKAAYLSIMIDGAKDTAKMENEVVFIRLLTAGGPKNIYVGIQEVRHAHAAGVLEAVETCEYICVAVKNLILFVKQLM